MRALMKRFSNYLNKENFVYTHGEVDPYKFHSSFTFLAEMFSVTDVEPKPWWMYASPVFVALTGAWATTLFVHSVVVYLPNFSTKYDSITECLTYALVMIYKSLIVSRCFTKRNNYYELLRALRQDFEYINNKGKKYSKDFFINQKFTFRVCVQVAIFVGFIGAGIIGYSAFAMTWATVKNKPRPSLFGVVWFWGHPTETPYLELLLLQCLWFTTTHTYTYIFYMTSQVLWVREIACKADICVWNIKDLLTDVKPAKNKREEEYNELLIKHRMRIIMETHNSMIKLLENYAACYRFCLLFEQKLSSPIICMTAYCTAEKLEDGEAPIILLLLCVAVIVVVYIPSYLCTFLSEKVNSVGEAWMYVPFWNAARVVRPYAVLMIQRSMRPLPIQAAGFEDISLQTYAKILSRSYQWFTMLRQANFNK